MGSIDELLDSPALKKLARILDTFTFIQENINAVVESDDDTKRKLIKAATVFQIFLIQTLAEGKKPKDLTNEDWKAIAEKVSQHAIMSDGQQYSVFVFTIYASYIDASADWLFGKAAGQDASKDTDEDVVKATDEVASGDMSEDTVKAMDEAASRDVSEDAVKAMDTAILSIKELSAAIRFNTEQLQCGELSEVDYIEGCLWISLEAMIKLLACSLKSKIGPEYAYFAQAVAQLAFEYGRLVLFTREQKLLESYIKNQYILDEELQAEYEEYLAELNEYSESFRGLIDAAFTPGIHDSLMKSADLARAAGVKEEELLTSIEDVDNFFLN